MNPIYRTRISILRILAVLPVITLIFLSACSKNAEDNFQTALEYYKADRFNEAIPYFAKTISIEPENIKSRFFLGVCYKNTGDLNKALKYIEESFELNPNDFYILFHLGDTYLKLDQFDKAVTYARKSLGIKPDFMESHLLLGTALNGAGKVTEAVKELEFIVKIIKEENPTMYNQCVFQLGDLYRIQGRLEDSLKILTSLTSVNPDTPELVFSRGLTYQMMGNSLEAKNHLEKLDKMNSPLAEIMRKKMTQ
ncbi:MAG: tetratricopeptide repeat protein [Candidatus Auribacterota bacterium]|nr:tetratricopeptide repeat protein [Candidatus Auribacterota bacterium]